MIDLCNSMCWTGDEDVYCLLDEGHEGNHDDGNGWEWCAGSPTVAATTMHETVLVQN